MLATATEWENMVLFQWNIRTSAVSTRIHKIMKNSLPLVLSEIEFSRSQYSALSNLSIRYFFAFFSTIISFPIFSFRKFTVLAISVFGFCRSRIFALGISSNIKCCLCSSIRRFSVAFLVSLRRLFTFIAKLTFQPRYYSFWCLGISKSGVVSARFAWSE